MEVFWRKGYDGASLPELTAAMGINRPSLYATFGNKESLFRKVLDRYANGAATFIGAAIEQPTAKQAIEHILRGAVEFLSAKCHPRGCLLMQGTPPCGDEADSIRQEIITQRLAGQNLIHKRLKRAAVEGDLATDADAADVARFVSAIVHGMSIQAANGATRAQLQSLADMGISACAIWLRPLPSARSR